MTAISKILYPLLALFLLYRSSIHVDELWNAQPGVSGIIYQLFMSILLVVYITGIFAFPGFVFPTHKVIPASYFHIKYPLCLKRIYTVLGVKYFRIFLIAAFWRRKKIRRSFFDGTRRGILNFIYQTKQAEFGHLGAFIVLLILATALIIRGHSSIALIMMLLNILANGYPVILQRYHRMRIGKLVRSDRRL